MSIFMILRAAEEGAQAATAPPQVQTHHCFQYKPGHQIDYENAYNVYARLLFSIPIPPPRTFTCQDESGEKRIQGIVLGYGNDSQVGHLSKFLETIGFKDVDSLNGVFLPDLTSRQIKKYPHLVWVSNGEAFRQCTEMARSYYTRSDAARRQLHLYSKKPVLK